MMIGIKFMFVVNVGVSVVNVVLLMIVVCVLLILSVMSLDDVLKMFGVEDDDESVE